MGGVRPVNKMSLTLKDLRVYLDIIAEQNPELLDTPVEINFDSGSFREVCGVAVNPILLMSNALDSDINFEYS